MSPITIYQKITANLESLIQGQTHTIQHLLAAFISGGHVLLEDLPGTGKTTLAKALAHSFQVKFQRVQFTPDLLPADILGVSIFNQKEQTFNFHQGPIFTDILLADEINRASPRAQSALLEAMGERQVSIEGTSYTLSDVFFVIATQNPIEFHGTYPLPEAQMDRFAMRLSLGYVNADQEVAILSHHQNQQEEQFNNIQPLNLAEINHLRQAIQHIRISEELKYYIVNLVNETRHKEGVQMGASPRASLTLMKTAQALAIFNNIDFVTPEHIQELAIPVIAHRLKLDSSARFGGLEAENIVKEILQTVPVPN